MGVLGLYVLIVGGMLFLPALRPQGLPEPDLQKLIATLAVWLACVLIVEFSPVQEEA
jgi:hypothetical protein